MKKSLRTLMVTAIMLLIAGMLFSDVLLEESFEDTFPPTGWTLYSTGSVNWEQEYNTSSPSGSYCVETPGTGPGSTKIWMITPAIDLTGYTAAQLKYWDQSGIIMFPPSVSCATKISTDYIGSGDPSYATWTNLVTGLHSGSWQQLTFDISAYTGGTVYIAYYFTGTRVYQNIDEVWVGAGDIPDAPVALAPTTDGTLTFSANWEASTGATCYRLNVAEDSLFTSNVDTYTLGDVLTYQVTLNPDEGGDHWYRVEAGTDGGYGDYSNVIMYSAPDSIPVATEATKDGTMTFYANWEASTDVTVTGYYLDVAADNGFSAFLTGYENLDVGNVLTYPVIADTTIDYYYRVRATNGIGSSSSSNVIICNVLLAPVATDATTDGTLTFYANWEASADSNIVIGYYLDASTDSLFATFSTGYENLDVGNVLTYPVTANTGITHYYRVRAYGSAVTSLNSNVITVSHLITGDFNSDGYVDASDLQLLGDNWHFVDTDADWDSLYDLDPDGIIDAGDLQVFGDHWHEGTPPDAAKGAGKGPNSDAGIVFDLDSSTSGNQNLTHIDSQTAGSYIRVDVYATGVHNLDTYEFEVVYDSLELEYISSAADNPLTYEENILTTDGGSAVGWMVDNSTPGILSIAYTLTGTDTTQAPDGEGLLADMVFKALVATNGELSFGDVSYYDSESVEDVITNTGTATLPVELSAFTATYDNTNGYTTIEWTTASETDVIGFNVYRSTEDYFDTSKQLNYDVIEGHGTTTANNTYEFIDNTEVDLGTVYYYWLESVEYSGINTVYSSINITPEEGTGGYVDDFDANSLSNFPNPFKNSTTISYSVKGMLRSQPVEINIYNMLGQLIDTVEGKNGTATWNTSDHATGIYFYKLNTDSYTETKKMMVTK